jgi:hypothetical protein
MDVAGDDHGVRQPAGADEIEHGLSVEWIPAHFSPPRVRVAGSALVSLGAKGTWLASRFHRAVAGRARRSTMPAAPHPGSSAPDRAHSDSSRVTGELRDQMSRPRLVPGNFSSCSHCSCGQLLGRYMPTGAALAR